MPHLEYDGFPTLILFTASNREVRVPDDVELGLDGLSRWLVQHAERAIDFTRLPKDEL